MAQHTAPQPLGLKDRYSSFASGSSGGPITAVLVVAFFGAWALVAATGGDFLTIDNLRSMLIRSVALGIVAIGQTLVILAGSLDLSVAYLISVTAVLSSVIMDGDPGRIALGVAVVLAVGALVGLVNGLVITKLRVNAFIATLGMALILKGLLTASFDNFSGAVPEEYQVLGYGRIGPFPWAVLLLAFLGGAVWYMLNQTRYQKPLANTLAEAQPMAEAAQRAEQSGVFSMVGFNYRRVPALELARGLIAEGAIGELRHVRCTYLQDWGGSTKRLLCCGASSRSTQVPVRSVISARTSSTSLSIFSASTSRVCPG